MPRQIQTISMADARAMTRAAEDCAARMGIPFSVAIVDAGGQLLHFSRGDGCPAGCTDLAIDKAWTAVAYGQPTAALAGLAQPGRPLYGIQHSLAGRAVVFGGGLPVRLNGAVIGGVGASACTVEQDAAVALAAMHALVVGDETQS